MLYNNCRQVPFAKELFNESQYVDSHVGETMRQMYTHCGIWNHFVVYLNHIPTLLLPNGYRLSALGFSKEYILCIAN